MFKSPEKLVTISHWTSQWALAVWMVSGKHHGVQIQAGPSDLVVLEPPNNCQIVVYFLYNSVQNEMTYNGIKWAAQNMNFVPTDIPFVLEFATLKLRNVRLE